MARETDGTRVELLARVLLGGAGFVAFGRKAEYGDPNEPDNIGLAGLLAPEETPVRKRMLLREALAEWLRKGNRPNRVDVPGDAELQKDPETRYEFRLSIRGKRVYVKVVWNDDDPADPGVVVKKVARQN